MKTLRFILAFMIFFFGFFFCFKGLSEPPESWGIFSQGIVILRSFTKYDLSLLPPAPGLRSSLLSPGIGRQEVVSLLLVPLIDKGLDCILLPLRLQIRRAPTHNTSFLIDIDEPSTPSTLHSFPLLRTHAIRM